MLRSKQQRRKLFGDKFLDLANYAVAGLMFSQLVGQQAVSWEIEIFGAALWLALAAVSYWLAGE